MEKVIFLFLRQMRVPLILLIVAYAISIGGLVLIPGRDDQGQVWHYDFFHAFYFVSFTGPTIGFGEIPYPLTPAQRMWVVFTVYLTVISWLFAIGKIFALVQDPAFTRAMSEARFIRAVRTIREPFYIVCGYGETGSRLVRSLVSRHIRCVVIERDPEQVADLHLEELVLDVPCMCGDASVTRHLREAGLRLPHCVGVLALTGSDRANVKIAVTSKLLRPDLQVIARVASREAANNLESFDTDVIINPFESFAEHTGLAVRAPSIHLLHRWLVSLPGNPLDAGVCPPRGHWVICGYGRFGQAMTRYLQAEGIDISVIESDRARIDEMRGNLPDRLVVGSATDPEPLHEAGIESAAGVVAGTEDDANNLSVIMTAQQINPRLFRIARQNKRDDDDIFQAARLDLVMEPSRVTVWQVLSLITVHYLAAFLAEARRQDEAWAGALLERIREATGGLTPQTWMTRLNRQDAPAAATLFESGSAMCVGHLRQNPRHRDRKLPLIALMHVRHGEHTLLPDDSFALQQGDRILWTAREGQRDQLAWLLHNPDQLAFAMDGQERPVGAIGRWWFKRRSRQAVSLSDSS